MRVAGVLMPIASLPSPYGIGDFGTDAFNFIDRLANAGVKLWQILPLNPLGYGNSPYQPYSSFAGEILYISPELLANDGLLTAEELKKLEERTNQGGDAQHIDYALVRQEKEILFRRAFMRFQNDTKPKQEYEEFATKSWVYSYGVFTALKKKNHNTCWNTWPIEEREWPSKGMMDETKLQPEITYQTFLQYLFFIQWRTLKDYANRRGISIMGDVPFYVGMDSQDVWENKQCFLLDADAKPTFVAGVPPDYFSATGQRWGNPIYDWEYLKKTKYQFWINRLLTSSHMFDIIRLDHFRAFDTYWKIPSSCDTAMEGEWVEAPGYDFFGTLYQQIPEIKLVVEDLGLLRPEVGALRDALHLPGMRVLQFTFGEDKPVWEQYKEKNILTYTGTHDNDTIKGWYYSLSKEVRREYRNKLKVLGVNRKSIAWSFIELCLRTESDMAIVPYQDLTDMDTKCRINTPGTVGSPNWEWRCSAYNSWDNVAAKLKKIIDKNNR